jgi:pimeloyl-ACP methyl ester carboxylesterase
MKKVIYLSLMILSLTSCLRLDSNLYNNSKIDAYQWDNYYGAVDFHLPESYNIPLVYMNELSLISNDTVSDTKHTIKGLYIGNMGTINQDTVILYLHGNRDHMDFYWPRAKLLANVGSKNRFGVMMIDYRGFGLSEGDPTEEGMNEDVTAALEWLKGKGVSSERLIMYGFSLGSAPATKLLAHPRSTLIPSKLILENPFASAEVMVQDASRLAMPSSFFVNVKVDVAQEIKAVQQPFLLLSSKDDKFLKPETNADLVAKNYKGVYKEVHSVPGADHGALQSTWGFENYTKTIEVFIVK